MASAVVNACGGDVAGQLSNSDSDFDQAVASSSECNACQRSCLHPSFKSTRLRGAMQLQPCLALAWLASVKRRTHHNVLATACPCPAAHLPTCLLLLGAGACIKFAGVGGVTDYSVRDTKTVSNAVKCSRCLQWRKADPVQCSVPHATRPLVAAAGPADQPGKQRVILQRLCASQ